jgi:Ca2+-binding EF-hand superfamily protein
MTNISYSVTESIHRQYGRIIKLVYDYDESEEQLELNLLTQKQDRTRHYRHYQAIIQRDEYERMIQSDMSREEKFSFDNFVCILRPIMMGTYVNNELQEAFDLLDKDQSGTIDLDELADFLPIIRSDITKKTLLHYVRKVDSNTDEKLNFDEFTDMILRGIGRDIICGHI